MAKFLSAIIIFLVCFVYLLWNKPVYSTLYFMLPTDSQYSIFERKLHNYPFEIVETNRFYPFISISKYEMASECGNYSCKYRLANDSVYLSLLDHTEDTCGAQNIMISEYLFFWPGLRPIAIQ